MIWHIFIRPVVIAFAVSLTPFVKVWRINLTYFNYNNFIICHFRLAKQVNSVQGEAKPRTWNLSSKGFTHFKNNQSSIALAGYVWNFAVLTIKSRNFEQNYSWIIQYLAQVSIVQLRRHSVKMPCKCFSSSNFIVIVWWTKSLIGTLWTVRHFINIYFWGKYRRNAISRWSLCTPSRQRKEYQLHADPWSLLLLLW